MKNLFKKKSKIPTASVPRKSEEIIKQYQELCFRVGQTQYEIAVRENEVKRLNVEIMKLNQEMEQRQQLDAAAKAEEKAAAPAPEQQVANG
mgnify:CR=1 FL=1